MFKTLLCVYFSARFVYKCSYGRSELCEKFGRATTVFYCCAQDHASEAMEVFNELMESEVSIIVPHIAEIISFCLEVGVKLYFHFLALY